jgi:hypothetical protein
MRVSDLEQYLSLHVGPIGVDGLDGDSHVLIGDRDDFEIMIRRLPNGDLALVLVPAVVEGMMGCSCGIFSDAPTS